MSIKNIISIIRREDLILSSGIIFIGNMAAGIINLFYHLVSVRMLSLEDYGVLNALLSAAMFALTITPSLRMAITRYFTELIAADKSFLIVPALYKIIVMLFTAMLLLLPICYIVSPFISVFLKTEIVFVNIILISIFIYVFSVPFLSIFQSLQKFGNYAIVWTISSLIKLICAIVFISIGWKILGGLIGFLAGSITFVFVSLVFLARALPDMHKIFEKNTHSISLASIPGYFFSCFILLSAFAVLTNVDVVLVRHFFLPIEAGSYSAAQIVGRIALFLPSAISIVMFPKCTTAFIQNRSSLGMLYKSIALGGACCVLVTSISFLYPDIMLKVITGKTNNISSALAGLFSLAMSFYALLWIVIHFSLATNRLKLMLPIFALAVLESVFLYNYHPSLNAVLCVHAIFAAFSFFTALFITRFINMPLPSRA